MYVIYGWFCNTFIIQYTLTNSKPVKSNLLIQQDDNDSDIEDITNQMYVIFLWLCNTFIIQYSFIIWYRPKSSPPKKPETESQKTEKEVKSISPSPYTVFCRKIEQDDRQMYVIFVWLCNTFIMQYSFIIRYRPQSSPTKKKETVSEKTEIVKKIDFDDNDEKSETSALNTDDSIAPSVQTIPSDYNPLVSIENSNDLVQKADKIDKMDIENSNDLVEKADEMDIVNSNDLVEKADEIDQMYVIFVSLCNTFIIQYSFIIQYRPKSSPTKQTETVSDKKEIDQIGDTLNDNGKRTHTGNLSGPPNKKQKLFNNK